MSIATLPHSPAAFVPLTLKQRPAAIKALAVLGATAFLALCSWISVPMIPVPVTMQTFGVAIVGAVFGWRLGTLAVLAWLLEAAIGLPVLSGGSAGIAYLVGPTGGYLVSFILVAAFVGWFAERGYTSRGLGFSFALMLVANLLILAIGAAWLAAFVGASRAIPLGVTPFLIGGLLKAALATTSIEAARRHLKG